MTPTPRQTSLGEARPRIVYCMVPMVIDGSHVYPDLTDDGDPREGYNLWVYSDSEIEGGYWAVADADDLMAAWDVLGGALEGMSRHE